ncbi:antitoxin of toxin-antitoxin stability system [Sphingomonas sp. 2R-10]|uniref:antitoxin of toxin-antitoxin stability system n=1 Tax=Sphingomonas sp. 2R-10 TaxID=3045148 RepID=UPI000F7B9F39|nr:antitoxin of toxin-antitoxin stability system [Sphingomonas sp. 2R-10]MDJ0278227.1 antitoxin of toxin-antitoxin stability system [Sphingomonas sp. 2R-10]
MTKAAVFTMKLEPELRADFMAAAEAAHRPASQVMRELMRDFVARQQVADEHRAFVERKVARALASAHADDGRSNEAVAADFAERRTALSTRA